MKNINSNSTNYLNSYDNEAFAPQEFDNYKTEQKPKTSQIIKRVKNDVGRIQPKSNRSSCR
jgi:hypothetical protein